MNKKLFYPFMKANNISMKQRTAKAAEIPKDVIMGMPVLTVTGDREMSVENYGGIIEYTEQIVRIRTKAGQIIINGKKLHIDYYTNDDMKIVGVFTSLEFKH